MKQHQKHLQHWRDILAHTSDYETLEQECEKLGIPCPTQDWADQHTKKKS